MAGNKVSGVLDADFAFFHGNEKVAGLSAKRDRGAKQNDNE